ncbi:MAG: hypothetical protein ACXWQ5_00400 [Ktedonobacterales bacterium]
MDLSSFGAFLAVVAMFVTLEVVMARELRQMQHRLRREQLEEMRQRALENVP